MDRNSLDRYITGNWGEDSVSNIASIDCPKCGGNVDYDAEDDGEDPIICPTCNVAFGTVDEDGAVKAELYDDDTNGELLMDKQKAVEATARPCDIAAKWKRRAKLFQAAYTDYKFEAFNLNLQQMQLEADGAGRVLIMQRDALKNKMLEVCRERNVLRAENKDLKAALEASRTTIDIARAHLKGLPDYDNLIEISVDLRGAMDTLADADGRIRLALAAARAE
jgi:hypothetical protein